jgi:Raf kinase inhibitor-like YbhB/YbcL family protein
MSRTILGLTWGLLLLTGCKDKQGASPLDEGAATMQVTSNAFHEGGTIPQKYTADGKDVSPPLKWSGAPAGTKSFALICDDPDAPRGTWMHWLVYNLPADHTELAEAIPTHDTLPNGAHQGKNSFNKIGYGGPSPPEGTHRYFFKIYALDAQLNLPAGANKQQLEKAMEGHVLARGELMGKYGR